MIRELYDYDIFPKVVLAGRENEITVKPLGWHAGIEAGKTYDLQISAMEQGEEKLYAEWADFKKITVTADADACLRFRYTFPSEQEYLISYYPKPDASPVRLSVYALADRKWIETFRPAGLGNRAWAGKIADFICEGIFQ